MIAGGITGIAGRLLSGWAGQPGAEPAAMELTCDGQVLGSTLAEPDPANARLIFEFLLPRALFDGAVHLFAAQIGGESLAFENASQFLNLEGEEALKPAGFLEKITEDGWVVGWAWYPQAPQARVEVEILIDGHPAGETLAGLFRADVAKAGYGEGCYGFSWPLPYYVLTLARDVTITARDKRGGTLLPAPRLFRQPAVSDAVSRIAELESELRLLNGTIASLQRRGVAEEHAAASLFATVGAFFNELAEKSAARRNFSELRPVRTAVADITAGFEPIVFPAASAPAVTLFVEAAEDLAATYASLRALRGVSGELAAEIFLLDDGACDETALLPLIVQNIRYARLAEGSRVRRCNDALRLGTGEVLVFIAAGVHLAPGWAEGLDRFAGHANLGALAAHVSAADGTLLSAGAELRGAEAVPRTSIASPHNVDAMGSDLFALRRALWRELAGLDEQFFGLEAALVEFCLRLRAAGNKVELRPDFAATRVAPAPAAEVVGTVADAERLATVIGILKEAAE